MDEYYNNDPGTEDLSAGTPNSEPEALDPSQVEIVGVQNGKPGVGPWPGSNNIYYDNPAKPEGSPALAIVSLVTGIVSLVLSMSCCCLSMGLGGMVGFLGLISVVTGALSMILKKPGSGMAIGGIVTGAVSVLIAIVSILMMIGMFGAAYSDYSSYSASYY